MTVDRDAWGIIASRPVPFYRQCFYFSELDIHFATLPRADRRIATGLQQIGRDHEPPADWMQGVHDRTKETK